jgi:gamma-glutamylcyclotransferase (GGCT)/AIG2-like uncharacterized protein YtfP
MELNITEDDVIESKRWLAQQSEGLDLIKEPDGDLLFTYGTLKRGMYNNCLLDGAEFIGEAVTVERYPFEHITLFGLPDKGLHVRGEVWSPAKGQWANLDRLERHPRWYCRIPTGVKLNDGTILKAWLYFVPARVGTVYCVDNYTRSEYMSRW